MHTLPRESGWMEVVCGPMFSGKTEELIRRLRRALFARQVVQIFKPQIDDRYGALEIVSHSRQRLAAIAVADAAQIPRMLREETVVVGIDEAQFFDPNIVDVTARIAAQGRRVVVAGLDLDFRGEPFGSMPALMAAAEFVTKTLAICVVCGDPAGRTQRIADHPGTVLIGAEETYEARCRRCHSPEATAATQRDLFVPEPALPRQTDLFSQTTCQTTRQTTCRSNHAA